jgi:hypothetical protein
MREKIRLFVDEVLSQIPAELPDDEVAFEVATRIVDSGLVPTSEDIVKISNVMTEYGVYYAGQKRKKAFETTVSIGNAIELSGLFVPDTVKLFAELDDLVKEHNCEELVARECRMIEEVCTNSSDSMTDDQLQVALELMIRKVKEVHNS